MKEIILIAEDDSEFSHLLKSVFEKKRSDVTVVCANDGEEAIAALKQMSVSVLVTDLQMPNVDGLELLAYVNSNHPDLPCIVMTSYMQNQKTFNNFVRALQPEIKDLVTTETFQFFNKPFKIDQMVEAVFQILDSESVGGSIHGISIASFIQMIEMDQKTCEVEVSAPNKRRGALYFVNGVLYNAKYGDLEGEEAAIQIIATDDLKINIEKSDPNKAMERKVHSESMGLIIEAMRRKDESTK